jgi:hypothetical protein
VQVGLEFHELMRGTATESRRRGEDDVAEEYNYITTHPKCSVNVLMTSQLSPSTWTALRQRGSRSYSS